MSSSKHSKNPPKGCFTPMNALAVHPQGQAHYCLTSSFPSQTDLNLLNTARQETHKELLDGNWPKTCLRCARKEDRGLQSRRMRTWLRKSRHYGTDRALEMVTNAKEPMIRHLEISFSSSCNLSCAMCSSEFSTGWIKHDQRAVEEGLKFREFTRAYPKVGRVSRELLTMVLQQIENIDLIVIKGGEPTREPMCLEFLHEVARRKPRGMSIFIQSNGTTKPKNWLKGLEDLEIEFGCSIDGWGEVFNWIRGPYFDQVLENLHEIARYDNIRFLTVDFTLSDFNVFHLPEFLKKILSLKTEIPKIKECPVFQWVEQPYGTPLAIPLENRLEVLAASENTLNEGKDFFLDSEFLVNVLKAPRVSAEDIQIAIQWFEFLKKIRGYSLGSTEMLLEQALQK